MLRIHPPLRQNRALKSETERPTPSPGIHFGQNPDILAMFPDLRDEAVLAKLRELSSSQTSAWPLSQEWRVDLALNRIPDAVEFLQIYEMPHHKQEFLQRPFRETFVKAIMQKKNPQGYASLMGKIIEDFKLTESTGLSMMLKLAQTCEYKELSDFQNIFSALSRLKNFYDPVLDADYRKIVSLIARYPHPKDFVKWYQSAITGVEQDKILMDAVFRIINVTGDVQRAAQAKKFLHHFRVLKVNEGDLIRIGNMMIRQSPCVETPKDFEDFWNVALGDWKKTGRTDFLLASELVLDQLKAITKFQNGKDTPEYPRIFSQLYSDIMATVMDQPTPHRLTVVRAIMPYLETLLPGLYQNRGSENKYDFETFRARFPLFAHVGSPQALLNHYMMHREALEPQIVDQFFLMTESSLPVENAKIVLPELTAMLTPYSHTLKQFPAVERNRMLGSATASITRIYNYLTAGFIANRTILPLTFNNWAKIGALGLSFTRWQFDTMALWKGQGPMQKASLFEQSGIFEKLPSRPDDVTFHGGYLYHNPVSRLTIEMRRAYIVISNPDLGTLVIRNSSPLFGRDLLQEPAYYNPDSYHGKDRLLDPGVLDSKNGSDKERFHSIFSLTLNDTNELQNHFQPRVKGLLEQFEQAMAPYIDWKCGFKGGRPPEGFAWLLKAALMSSINGGATTPFGTKRNIRLAWVEPYSLPFTARSFDAGNPANQQEMKTMMSILERKAAFTNMEEYQKKMPNLMAFLEEGMLKGWELVLKDAN